MSDFKADKPVHKMKIQDVKETAADIIARIHSSKDVIKNFAFCHLFSITDSDLQDTWIQFNHEIDLNIHDDEGVSSIQAYPVVNNSPVTANFVHIGSLNMHEIEFDPLEHFGQDDLDKLTPREQAQANVILYLIEEIENFKDLSTPMGLVVAAELYEIYLGLVKTTYSEVMRNPLNFH